MKLFHKQIGGFGAPTILARTEEIPCFDEQWHYHEELELIYNKKGRGIRFVGDNIGEFSDGELVLTGSNLPHLWRNDPEYYQDQHQNQVQAVIIQFKKEFLGSEFLQKDEAVSFNTLFQHALQGAFFKPPLSPKLIEKIIGLPSTQGMDRIIDFLEILNLLTQSSFDLLSNLYDFQGVKRIRNTRINAVNKYILDHIQDNIVLQDVAEIAHMTPNAFCRYFKKHTRKTLSQFVNEVRVSYACKKLQKKSTTIAVIANQCGYASLTYFNKQFKKINGLTPKEYRALHFPG